MFWRCNVYILGRPAQSSRSKLYMRCLQRFDATRVEARAATVNTRSRAKNFVAAAGLGPSVATLTPPRSPERNADVRLTSEPWLASFPFRQSPKLVTMLSRAPLAVTTALALASTATAADASSLLSGISSTCQSSVSSLISSEFASCADVSGLIPVVTASGSIISPSTFRGRSQPKILFGLTRDRWTDSWFFYWLAQS